MGWQKVGNHRYYYERKKVDGVVVSKYIGRGPEAEAKARLDAEVAAANREADQRDREVIRRWREHDKKIKAMTDILDWAAKEAIEIQMTSAGYHYVKGKWRKARKKKTVKPEVEAVLAFKREIYAKGPRG